MFKLNLSGSEIILQFNSQQNFFIMLQRVFKLYTFRHNFPGESLQVIVTTFTLTFRSLPVFSKGSVEVQTGFVLFRPLFTLRFCCLNQPSNTILRVIICHIFTFNFVCLVQFSVRSLRPRHGFLHQNI